MAMKIRNVADAKENLEQVLANIRNRKPISPELLKVAKEAVKRNEETIKKLDET